MLSSINLCYCMVGLVTGCMNCRSVTCWIFPVQIYTNMARNSNRGKVYRLHSRFPCVCKQSGYTPRTRKCKFTTIIWTRGYVILIARIMKLHFYLFSALEEPFPPQRLKTRKRKTIFAMTRNPVTATVTALPTITAVVS